MVGQIDMKQKGSASFGYWVKYVTLTFDLTHDLTKEERQERRNLVREAKRKQEQETSNPTEFRIRGPPRNLRIVWTVAKAN